MKTDKPADTENPERSEKEIVIDPSESIGFQDDTFLRSKTGDSNAIERILDDSEMCELPFDKII